VSGAAGDAKSFAELLPSRRSRDYGRSFAELFASVNGDFYAIDPMLFSPAMVIVTAIENRRELSRRRTQSWPSRCVLPPEAAASQPAARRPRVGLVVDNMDWHARALSRALVALGATRRRSG